MMVLYIGPIMVLYIGPIMVLYIGPIMALYIGTIMVLYTILMTTIQIKADMHAYKRILARDTYKL